MNDAAGDVVMVAQKLGDFIKIVLSKGFTQTGTWNTFRAVKKRGCHPNFKAQFFAERF